MGARSVLARPLVALVIAVATVAAGSFASHAGANTSHADWPAITGMLAMNKTDGNRPIDAIPGEDPFDGTDPSYSCDEVHKKAGNCHAFFVPGGSGRVVADKHVHNELLGGHGNDTIHAGPTGDVIWGDYKPSGQPTAQHDRLYGNSGNDVIYASHGYNMIAAGSGDDIIKAHFGRGIIDCGPGDDLLYVSRAVQSKYTIHNCETISHKTLGY